MRTRSSKIWSLLYFLVRTSLGLVFVWASWDKILYPDRFATIIANYDLLPSATINLAALVLPWIELVCGVLLLVGRMVPGAVFVVNTLLFVFILATGFNLYRGLDVNCGCFSVAPDAGGETLLNLLRNGLLLTGGVWLFFYGAGHMQADRPTGLPSSGAR